VARGRESLQFEKKERKKEEEREGHGNRTVMHKRHGLRVQLDPYGAAVSGALLHTYNTMMASALYFVQIWKTFSCGCIYENCFVKESMKKLHYNVGPTKLA
jgi:hypothetical protein